MPNKRNYVFTLNNYSSEEEKKLLNNDLKHANYILFGREKGSNGTPHLQGYVEFRSKTSISQAKKTLGSERYHLEPRRGSQDQAITYCKKDGDYSEIGTRGKQGKRTDLIVAKDVLKQGASISRIYDDYPSVLARYPRFVQFGRLQYLHSRPRFTRVDVHVFYGKTGTGKTRRAYELDQELYRVVNSPTGIWFDGYDGEQTILIDDFYGWIKYSYMLELLDGYSFQLPIKGGWTWKCWTRVIITSNDPPSSWYSNLFPEGTPEALERRITHLEAFVNEEEKN